MSFRSQAIANTAFLLADCQCVIKSCNINMGCKYCQVKLLVVLSWVGSIRAASMSLWLWLSIIAAFQLAVHE